MSKIKKNIPHSKESALEYFSDPEIEQYERCAFLLKIINLKKEV